MGIAIAASIIITIALTASFIFVTNKAYSRKWDDEGDEKRGQF